MRFTGIRALMAALLSLATMPSAHAEDGAKWLDDKLAVRKEVIVSPGAAGLDAKAATFPFVLRLSNQSLAFEDVKPDGADLRVAGPDGARVDHYVESFDAQAGLATVWVRGANLDPAGKQTYHLYYGGDAASTANSAGVFDASEVLALDFSNGVKDRTRNNNSATSVPLSAGFAGQSATFGGGETLRVSGSSSLDLDARPFTVMLWVKPKAATGLLVDRPNAFAIGLNGGTVTASVGGGQVATTAQLAPGAWSHIALVARPDGRIEVFVNGKLAGQGQGVLPTQTGDIVIGQGFAGQIDNLRIAAADRTAGYIRAVAQSDNGRGLVTFGAEQEQGSKFEVGYFLTVVKSVTIEGWVVIALCAVLLALAIRVMVQKFGLLGRIEKQNAEFEKAYGASAELEGGALSQEALRHADSTLGQLYQAGLTEVSHRSAQGRARFTPAAIEALKARIDAVSSNQAYDLSDKLVILTLSIAGGPFLGLLGTVIGVMITFAAIAAQGNVNVNSIAPGVAAALLATAAGLAVAIPALFGYNLILTRIKKINAGNRSFADALVARIAEQYGA